MQDSVFEEVKDWLKKKGVVSGNPEDIIEKSRLNQRQVTISKLSNQN